MKKNKIIMSIIFVLVLLIICIISFTNNKIYSFLGIENLSNEIGDLTSNNSTNTKSSSESTSKPSLGTSENDNPLNIYKTTISDYKLKSMNELVKIGLLNSKFNNFTFSIKSAKATRNCPGYTLEDDTLKGFSSEVMDAKGNLLKEYYYLDIKITVTNTGSNTTSFPINSLEYITISEKHEALWRNTYYSEGARSNTIPYYWEETDGKSLIPMMELIMNFEPGETCEYRACYIVPEEYNSNDLYLFYCTGRRSIDDEAQRFIKLDIQ